MPRLFSYGTFQREDIHLSTFGRPLNGRKDELVGYEPSLAWVTATLVSGRETWVYVHVPAAPSSGR